MTIAVPEDNLSASAGARVRPYIRTGGRTRPSEDAIVSLDLEAKVFSTHRIPPQRVAPDHREALQICDRPRTVAEVAARLRLPVALAKVLLRGLIDVGAVAVRASTTSRFARDRETLERLHAALQQL
ncbi:DUF742 domain-containing protein [Saccharopolyspora sp. NPDC003752]